MPATAHPAVARYGHRNRRTDRRQRPGKFCSAAASCGNRLAVHDV